jgi:thiol-disulfide isomerase/thioredoxin
MARTPSSMVPLGTPAPHFSLQEPKTGKTFTLKDFQSAPGFLVIFMCNHCPYVKHLAKALTSFGNDYHNKLAIVAINANDADAYPEDSPENMVKEVREHGYPFPYLYDPTQQAAKDYDATCTPDFFLFNQKGYLVYRGQFDDSRPGKDTPVTGADLRNAVDALLSQKPISENQKASLGCNIKWRIP